jgi:Na+/H+ antiporter NhaD/arsenite permease-like protein
MFIDSITVMLLATVTVELPAYLNSIRFPVIIAEIFASNTGGSATMSGDPPNIIIAPPLVLTSWTCSQYRSDSLGRVIIAIFFLSGLSQGAQ